MKAMSLETSISNMRGPHAAIFTPLDDHGEVNFEMLGKIVEFQLSEGLNGFFVAGSTGEGLLLSEQERTEVLKKVIEVSAGRGNVIAHVGHPSTDVATRLATSAAEAGADWIASIGPIYHGTTFEGALRHYTQIATATDLPFMVYAIGQEIVPARDLAFFDIPNVCGLKYTGANVFSVQQLLRHVDRKIAVMGGFDEQFVACLSFGFSGGIGSTYNFAPKFYADIYRLYHAGRIEQAAELQAEINKVTYLMAGYENWSYRKAIMKYIGFDCGAYRPPYAPLTAAEYEAYAAKLDELNVLKKASV